MNENKWRKSTYSSSNGGDCVEVGMIVDHGSQGEALLGQASGDIAIRDTKAHEEGPVLRFAPQQWTAFLQGIRNS
jgi:hypothetical protein